MLYHYYYYYYWKKTQKIRMALLHQNVPHMTLQEHFTDINKKRICGERSNVRMLVVRGTRNESH